MKSAGICLMLLTGIAVAKQVNPADYPLKAYVIGSQSGHRPSGAWACTYELAIDDLVYVTVHNGSKCDSVVKAGANLPVRLHKNDVKVLKDGRKELSLEIIGTHK